MISTDIDFPVDLPCPLKEEYDLNTVQTFLRTEMQSGRAKQRRRFSDVPTMANVKWHFQGNEAAVFEIWFKEAIHDGADWFNINLVTPLGEMPYVCRFVSMYKGPTMIGALKWRISAQLEIYERPIMPDGWSLLPEYIIHADIFDIAMNREWPETV